MQNREKSDKCNQCQCQKDQFIMERKTTRIVGGDIKSLLCRDRRCMCHYDRNGAHGKCQEWKVRLEVSYSLHASPAHSHEAGLSGSALDVDCTPVLSPCHPWCRAPERETAANSDSVVTRISHRTLSMVITTFGHQYSK